MRGLRRGVSSRGHLRWCKRGADRLPQVHPLLLLPGGLPRGGNAPSGGVDKKACLVRNIKLTIEYDGTDFHGWQIQPGLRTIQGGIKERIAQTTQGEVNLIGAGRTDAGVHALGQVANFQTESAIDLAALQRGLNSLLSPDIVIKGIEEVEEGFHARFSARSKRYEYHILNRSYPSALLRAYAWFIPHQLDLAPMERCVRVLIGGHDSFSS